MLLQISISGYSGAATTLICFIDEDSDAMIVSKSVPFSEKRMKNCVHISNMDLPERDFFFEETMLRDAIMTYFRRSAQGTLDVMEELSRYKPDNKIEMDAVQASGTQYRIDPTIDNGQMAVLAAVAYATHISPMEKSMSMMEDLTNFYRTI